VLDAVTATPAAIRSAVMEVLADPLYQKNVEPLRNEIAGLPEPEVALALLEQLAKTKQPVIHG